MASGSLQRRLGLVVRRRREATGISQEELAYRAKVHRTYVSMVERGLGNPSLSVLGSLAEALDSSLSSIFREVEQA